MYRESQSAAQHVSSFYNRFQPHAGANQKNGGKKKKKNKTRKHRRAICTQKRMLADNPEKRTQPISFFFSFLTFLT
jgi:hypothetical protein